MDCSVTISKSAWVMVLSSGCRALYSWIRYFFLENISRKTVSLTECFILFSSVKPIISYTHYCQSTHTLYQKMQKKSFTLFEICPTRIGRIFYLWRQKTSKPDISRLWGYFHLVRMARFERATPCLGGRCSIQLSYIRNNKYYSKNLYLVQLKNFILYSGWQYQASSASQPPFSGLLVKQD